MASARKKILCCVGTRPEVIKMAPVIKAFQAEAASLDCRVLVTAQHREMLDQMLKFFGITPHVDLDSMRANQSLADLTARMLVGLDGVLANEKPDLVVVQGDTTTLLAVALASFYRRIPFAHVEAGLRTHQIGAPFPEEANRVLSGKLACLHFAPTPAARANLLREGYPDDIIHMTGNTVIDALFMAVQRATPIGVNLDAAKKLILVTAHRRDNFGDAIRHICQAVAALSERFPDCQFLWPVHPNPNIQSVVAGLVGGQPRIHLCEPLGYGSFVTAMKQAHLILTDSGGVQEEAPALGKPILVMRGESERPEGIQTGGAILVGTDQNKIISETTRLLRDQEHYDRMSRAGSPYGDGKAAGRIVQAVRAYLEVAGRRHKEAA